LRRATAGGLVDPSLFAEEHSTPGSLPCRAERGKKENRKKPGILPCQRGTGTCNCLSLGVGRRYPCDSMAFFSFGFRLPQLLSSSCAPLSSLLEAAHRARQVALSSLIPHTRSPHSRAVLVVSAAAFSPTRASVLSPFGDPELIDWRFTRYHPVARSPKSLPSYFSAE
jgi:hypothetical protein